MPPSSPAAVAYPRYLDALANVPVDDDSLRRIAITTGCTDSRAIPKQPGAGSTRDAIPWPVQVMHNGVLVARDGYYGPWMTRIIERLAGHHEPQEELVFHEILASLPDATTMLELGAYWAYYSLWFLNQFPHGRTILVEPDPNCLAIGRYNYALNGREGQFIQAAVAARPSDAADFLCNSDATVRRVPRVSVDSLVEQLGCDRIDVLLADIQGAELAMLEGAQDTLRRRRLSTLVVSTHDHAISGDFLTHEKCLAWIREHGGRIIAEHSVDESFSGDGLIAAAFDDRCPITVAVSHNRAADSLFGSPAARLAAQAGDTRRLAAQVAVATASHARRLHLDAARPRTAWQWLSRPRRLWRRLPEWIVEAAARRRVGRLRRGRRTRIVLGEHALFEVLADERTITPALLHDLHWEYPMLEQVVRTVAATTGTPLTSATLVDVGANVGLIGLQAVASGLVTRCIAFEPDPVNFALLAANVRLNGLDDRFELHAVALGDRHGACRFELSGDNCGDHRVRHERPVAGADRYGESARKVITVPMRTLDDTIGRSRPVFRDRIGLCWMDAQGFEAAIVRGGLRTLSARAWPSVLEFWPYGMLRAGVSAADIAALLARIWTRFAVLEVGHPPAWRPVSQAPDLWQELGETGPFTNILLVR
jgi:FkbM family methyltransferase